MSYDTPPPGERGYSQDPNQEYPPRPTDRPAPVWPASHQDWHGSRPVGPDRNRMPWWGKGCLGIIAGFFLLVALAIVFGDPAPEPEPQPDPPATSQPAPEPEPEPSITVETTEPDNDDVVAEAGGDQALLNYNATFDDPSSRGDESGYLDHMMAEDREVYLNTSNDAMLALGLTVCDALDEGYTTIEILDMFPASLSPNTQSTTVSGAVGFLCNEHFDRVQQEVGEATGEI